MRLHAFCTTCKSPQLFTARLTNRFRSHFATQNSCASLPNLKTFQMLFRQRCFLRTLTKRDGPFRKRPLEIDDNNAKSGQSSRGVKAD